MSIVIHRNKKVSELKLKLFIIMKTIDNALLEVFISSSYGYFKSALGYEIAEKRYKNRIKTNQLQGIALSVFFSLAAGASFVQEESRWLGLIFLAVVLIERSLAFLAQNEKQQELESEVKEVRRGQKMDQEEIADLKARLDKLEKKEAL